MREKKLPTPAQNLLIKNMSNTYNAKQVDAWLDQAAKDLPAKRLADLFGNTFQVLSKRASRTLNKTTLMAIVKRVLLLSQKQYPVLEKIKVDSSGISFEQFSEELVQTESVDANKAFRHLFSELFEVLGGMSADIITTSLQNQHALQETNTDFSEDSALQRLEALYDISKFLATFESLEKTFPEILRSLSSLYSFKTIFLLLEKNGQCSAHLWLDVQASQESIDLAYKNAKRQYEYFVAPIKDQICLNKFELPFCSLYKNEIFNNNINQYISLPLSLSNLQTFGILQFESFSPVCETDISFINALSNLLAVTLDRYNKEQESEIKRQLELSERNNELVQVQGFVTSLEKERELREQFVATLTHDLRTPLTAAKMGAQFILRRPEIIEKTQQLAVKIIKSIDRMDQMIKDLLDANRIRAGEPLSLTMNYCDLKDIAITTLRELGAAYGDRFLLEMEKENITGFWNEDGIRRVIENLVSNAVKYGFPQQLITVSLKQTETLVQIVVHNMGNPIPLKDQEELFLPFHRTSSAQRGGKKGWGLGLTLVRGVVEAHGGEVKVVSTDSEGTSFTVTMPKDSRAFQILN